MIYLLVPARDDARRLERLLPALAGALPGECVRVVVVDDGSRDDTRSVVGRFAGALDV
jgi:glycosyltransferase involved in cell wall biosynthesis